MAGLGTASFLADDDPRAAAPEQSRRPVARDDGGDRVASAGPHTDAAKAKGWLDKGMGGSSLTIDGSEVTMRDVLFGKGTTRPQDKPVSMKDILFGKMPATNDKAAEGDPAKVTYGTSGGQSRAGRQDPAYIREGLIKRGLPPHVAEAFVMNMEDESGLDSGINEIEPLVEGSRGGYGLYQLTGPRRRQYEAFAEKRGVGYADVDAQLDFLVQELKTTEKKAAQRIFSTQNPQEAAVAVVEDFLRPAEEHQISRAQKYMTAGYSHPISAGSQSTVEPNKLWLGI